MQVFTRIVLRAGPLALLIVLILLARSPYSHSAAGTVQLFVFSLFVSIGFLLFGGKCFEMDEDQPGTSA